MILAALFTILLGLLSLFQFALAFGAPWGRLAWGGQNQAALPVGLRVASGASILIYAVIALFGLDRGGVIEVFSPLVSQVGMWVIFGYLALGVLMNAVSRSKAERIVMTPVALVLAALAFFIALG